MKIKPLTLLFLVFLTWNQLSAAILTVNNSNPSPGQYSDLQVAIDAAQAGDTLLIHRSATSYGNITLNKKLALIGEGSLANKITPQATTLGNLTLSYDANGDASFSKIIGLALTNLNIYEKDVTAANSVTNIGVSHCRITTLTFKNKVSKFSLKYSTIGTVSNGNLFDCEFFNNIVNLFGVSTVSGENNVLMNNLFLIRLYVRGAFVLNNIFYNSSGPLQVSAFNVSFVKNMLFGTAAIDRSIFSSSGNTATNNFYDINPMFVNPIIYNSLAAYNLLTPAAGPFANFHLQAGSPAIGAGTDGTDLGIYGGASPWRDGANTDSRFRYFPLPDAVPVITGLSVPNPVVNAGGTLQIQLNATTQP